MKNNIKNWESFNESKKDDIKIAKKELKEFKQWDKIKYDDKDYYFNKITNNAIIIHLKPNKLSSGLSIAHKDYKKIKKL